MNYNNTEDMMCDELPKCRICWDQEGHMICPCICSGSVMYVHEDCIRQWIEKSVKLNKLEVQKASQGYSKVKCELCKGDILFVYEQQSGCLKRQEVKEKINENKGAFICMGLMVLIMFFVGFIILGTSINDFRDSKRMNVFGIIFLIIFDLVIFIVAIRFLYGFIFTYFRGNSIRIHLFKTKDPQQFMS